MNQLHLKQEAVRFNNTDLAPGELPAIPIKDSPMYFCVARN